MGCMLANSLPRIMNLSLLRSPQRANGICGQTCLPFRGKLMRIGGLMALPVLKILAISLQPNLVKQDVQITAKQSPLEQNPFVPS
jgi:hypothetical protein